MVVVVMMPLPMLAPAWDATALASAPDFRADKKAAVHAGTAAAVAAAAVGGRMGAMCVWAAAAEKAACPFS